MDVVKQLWTQRWIDRASYAATWLAKIGVQEVHDLGCGKRQYLRKAIPCSIEYHGYDIVPSCRAVSLNLMDRDLPVLQSGKKPDVAVLLGVLEYLEHRALPVLEWALQSCDFVLGTYSFYQPRYHTLFADNADACLAVLQSMSEVQVYESYDTQVSDVQQVLFVLKRKASAEWP